MAKTPDAFRQLKAIHLALLGLVTTVTIAAIILAEKGIGAIKDESLDRILQAVFVLIAVVSVITGFNLFRKKIMEIRTSKAAGVEKMMQYRTACILWWAMIEGPCIFAAIGLMITGNFAFLALALFLLAALAVFSPRKQNIILLLNLNSAEVQMLEGK